jgi:nucleotide-binding universal stress UspA family protein
MIMETGASMNKDDTTHRIVVGVDGSEHSMAALEWAAVQAQRTGVDLEVVAAFGPGYRFLSRSEADKCMQEDVAEAMVRAEKLAPGVDITSTTFEGPPETGLITEGSGADLLVVGSRGLGGFKCLLLGSVSRACVHRARCPVVVVAQPGPASDALMTERDERSHRIVVGIDGSPSSIAALEWAANQAELTGASLEVLMTWEWLTGYGWSPINPDFDQERVCQTALSDHLKPVRDAHPGISIQAAAIEGHPAPLLVKASEGADLLVVGSRGHGEFVGVLLGSVSEHCVTNAHCPVLVLHDGK